MLKALTILIADDTEHDVVLVKHHLKAAKILNDVQVVTDGERAICYIKGEGEFGNRQKFAYPALLFLDLRLPRVNGYEILDFLKSSAEHKDLPVIVLSVFGDLKHMNCAYQKGARSFLIKPVEMFDLVNAIKHIKDLRVRTVDNGLRVEKVLGQ